MAFSPFVVSAHDATAALYDGRLMHFKDGEHGKQRACTPGFGDPWDCILSAEVFRAYKPDPRTYGGVAETFDVPPEQVMLVATHHNDLEGARACRLQTAYIERPLELGARDPKDVSPRAANHLHARDFLDLAWQLGC